VPLQGEPTEERAACRVLPCAQAQLASLAEFVEEQKASKLFERQLKQLEKERKQEGENYFFHVSLQIKQLKIGACTASRLRCTKL
jgi:hypothetical protein